MARYLVTGGCGFIGSHLVDRLLGQGHAVRVLDNLSSGRRENLAKEAELIVGDVADRAAVSDAMQGVDGCFHLAAVASVALSSSDWIGTHRTNLTGTITVFDCARKTAHRPALPAVYASSAAVYGDNPNMPLTESAATRPLSAYGADKLGCELHAHVAATVHDVSSVGLRFFNVYGPRQDPRSPYSGVISIFLDSITSGREITIFGDGSQSRDFVYVSDVALALCLAMDKARAARSADSPVQAPVVNVCTGRATSILELAELIGRLCGSPPAKRYAAPRPGDIKISIGSPDLAEKALGFSARTDLTTGLSAMLKRPG